MALDLIPVEDNQPQEPSAPKLDLVPVDDNPKLPDTSDIQKTVNDNISKQDNDQEKKPDQDLNSAFGYNVLGPYKQGDTLPAPVRKHINDCYANGTATTAADCMQSTVPQVAAATPLGTAVRSFGLAQPSAVAGIAGATAAASLAEPIALGVAALSGPYAPITGGAVEVAAGLGGAILGAAPVQKAVDVLLDKFPEVADKMGVGKAQLLADAKNPNSQFVGNLISNLPYFTPALASKAKMLLMGAIGGGQEIGREWSSPEEFSAAKILAAATVMAVSNKETFAGEAITSGATKLADRTAAGYSAMKKPVAEKLNIDPSQVTNDHIDSTLAAANPHDLHPNAEDYNNTATVIFGKDGAEKGAEILRKINSETGVRPEEAHADTVSNPDILKQILAGDVPKQYDHLREPIPETTATKENKAAPFKDMTKEEFMGSAKQVPSGTNSDMPLMELPSTKSATPEPFLDGKYTIKHGDSGSSVYDGDKLIASYNNDNDLVVDPAYRKQGIGEELLYQRTLKTGEAPSPTDVTPESKRIYDRVFDRLKSDANKEPTEQTSSGGGGEKEPPKEPQSPEYQDAQKKILDTISIGEKEQQKPGLTWDKIYTAIVDKLNPIKESMQSLGQKISSDKDAYKILRLMASVGDKGKHFLEQGTIDFNTGKINGKSLKEVLAPVKDDLNGFRAYITSKRALELESRGIKTGKDADAARQVINGGMDKFEAASKELNDYQTRLLKYLKDAGILNDDQFSAIKNANADYIPYYRLMEEGERSGGSTSGSPIKRIKGSERITIDPLESIIRNTYAFTKIAEKNSSVKSAYDNWSAQPHPEDYFTLDNAKPAPVKVTDQEMQKFLKENNIHDVPEDALTIFRASRRPLAKDQIGFFDNGKFKVLKVDPDMAEAFNSIPKEQHNLLMSLLKFPASALRAGLTTPEFIVRHLVRNQLSASTLSEKGNIPFYDTFKGLVSYLKKDEDYQMALRSGALPSIEPFLDRDTVQDQLKKLTSTAEGPVQKLKEHLTGDSIIDTAKNVVKSPIEFLHALQQTLETSTRLGAFKRALGDQEPTKANMTEAAFHARNIAPDPGRIGSKTGFWNSITALFNTEIQHTDQLTNALRKNTLPTLAKLFAGITLPSIALWAHNKDNPLYQNTPPWEKDFFWIVPLGDQPGDTVLRIPKPFLMGEVFGSVPERMLDKLFENDPHNFGLEHLANDLVSWATPNIIPTGPEAVIEQLTNHSFFKGENLVPERQKGVIPEERYTPYTSELTKSLGAAIGHVPVLGKTSIASPIVLDNYIYKWTGGIGTYIWQTADKALRSTGLLPDPVKPASTLADDPFIKAFVSRNPASNAAPILEFEENFKQKQEIYNTIKSAEKDEDQDKADSIRKRFSFDDDDYSRLKETNAGIINEYKAIKDIQKNPEISPQEKRQLIDQAYNEMIQATKSANEYPNKSTTTESNNENEDEEEQP